MNGFEVLQTVPTHGPPFVIFVTAHDCYALSAIRVHAVGYLLKPFSNRRFFEALQHARMQIRKQKMVNKLSRNLPRLIDHLDRETIKKSESPDYLQRISLKDGGRITFLRVMEIDWIEAADNYVSLHCNGRSYLLRGTLSSIEKKLNPNQFLRIHRSRIVNVNKIKEMKPLGSGDCRVTLQDGTALISSRTYSKQRRNALNFLP
jgi:two-component system LytT family response regulator